MSDIAKFKLPSRAIFHFLLITLCVFFIACSYGDNDDPENDAPIIFDLETPDFIPIGLTQTVYFHVTADDNQGLDDIEQVYFTIQNPDSSLRPDTSFMYDDGQNGDVTNGDGIYTFAATSSNTPQNSGDYTYIFIAKDKRDSHSDELSTEISIAENANPYLFNLSAPGYVQNGFPYPYIISVQVSDAQGLSDIDEVYFKIENPQGAQVGDSLIMLDDGTGDDTTPDDGVYTYTISDGSVFTIDGDYSFYFYAKDINDSLSNELVEIIPTYDGPYITDLVAPDSLRKGSMLASFLSVRAWDPQGMADIDSVYFWVIRPDSTSNGIRFYMYDDGRVLESGDSTANDSIYSSGIQPPGETSQSGNYTFYFTAFDMGANEANVISKQIMVYDPPLQINKDLREYKRRETVNNIW